jgi:hypothetical protein
MFGANAVFQGGYPPSLLVFAGQRCREVTGHPDDVLLRCAIRG